MLLLSGDRLRGFYSRPRYAGGFPCRPDRAGHE